MNKTVFLLLISSPILAAFAIEPDLAEILRAVPPPGAEVAADGTYGYSGHKDVDELRARMREHRYAMRRKMMPSKPYRTTIQGATWEYRVTDTASTLEGATNPSKKELVIPAEFEGKSVLTLNSYLFVPIDPPITKITLPKTLTEVGEKKANPFRNMVHLEAIEFAAENARYATLDGAIYTKDFSELIAVPAGKHSVKLAENLKVIRAGAFANSELEGELTLPKSVESICDAAFMGAKHLKKLIVPEGAEVAPSAFAYCTAEIVK